MKIHAYLLIDSDGTLQIRKSLPNPRVQQVAIKLAIQIDDSWFKQPIPVAELVVPNNHIRPSVKIHTEAFDNTHEFVNSREEIEDDQTGATRAMTTEERQAWDAR
jgi:hypothetical protein